METFKEILGIQSNIEAVYWLIALAGTFLFFVKIVLSFSGSEAEDVDFSDGIEGGDGVDHVVSVETIIAFLKGAGWIGVICYRITSFSSELIIPLTLVTGFITFGSVYYLLIGLQKLESSGTIDFNSAIGNIGQVYLGIPASGFGIGQIQVAIQGRLATVNAKSDKGAIKTGEKVLVCYMDKKDGVLVVAPFPYEEKI